MSGVRPLSGFDLATRRRRAGVKQGVLATAYGVQRQRIALIERERRPTREAVERYLAALKSLEPLYQ
jgi:DNA-binding XRE family transcriptional regulator